MDGKSSVIFASSVSDKKAEDIIELLLGDLPEARTRDEISYYPWHISTKYYDVDVFLLALNRRQLLENDVCDSVEGLVLYFDCNSDDWSSQVDRWSPFVNECDPEIRIVLCDVCSESVRQPVLEWCLREKYELVELEGVSCDVDFPETVGVARVKQALEAHVWPDLVMKARREPTDMRDLLSGDSNRNLALYLSQALERDTAEDSMNFEGLFSELISMKEKAASLEPQQRKDFAEKVVTAYWNAIGGDSDELSDSSCENDYQKL